MIKEIIAIFPNLKKMLLPDHFSPILILFGYRCYNCAIYAALEDSETEILKRINKDINYRKWELKVDGGNRNTNITNLLEKNIIPFMGEIISASLLLDNDLKLLIACVFFISTGCLVRPSGFYNHTTTYEHKQLQPRH